MGEGQAKSGENGIPFLYTSYADWRVRDLTFYLHDHLGNMRVTYTTGCTDWVNSPNSGRTLVLEHAADYFPYGSILREQVNTSGPEKYLTTHHERDQATGLDYRGARYYDSDVARFLSLDPLASSFVAWSPYNYVLGNPINLTDPTGKSATEYDSDGNKISDLGGNKIDFFHQEDGDTRIVDRASGDSNIINDGQRIIKGFKERGAGIGPSDIYDEFKSGTGPEKSMFSSFNNETSGPFESLRGTFSLYTSKARDAMLNSTAPKAKSDISTYGEFNPFRANGLWEQMFGRSNVSWYKVGDQVIYLMADSKSVESLWLRTGTNHSRATQLEEGNTYQTYIWSETIGQAQNNSDARKAFYKNQLDKEQRNIFNGSKF